MVALTRILFGWLMHSELGGIYPAVVVGACAPAMLAQVAKGGHRSTPADELQGGALYGLFAKDA